MAESKLDIEGLVNSTFGEHFGMTLNRLRELAEADNDGRLVVLPCKVGNTVWVVFGGVAHRGIVGSFSIRHGNKDFFIHSEGRDDEPEFQTYCHYEDFGKTVFLTRSEAVAALVAMKGGNPK